MRIKKGDISVNLIFKVILVVIAVATALIIFGLISDKGGELLGELRNALSLGSL